MKLPTLTTAQKLKLFSLALIVADTALAYGDKIGSVPGVPGWLAHLWPFVLMLSGIVHKSASIFMPPPAAPSANPPQS